MKIFVVLLAFLLPSGSALAGVTVTPREIDNGGVALLRWAGAPSSLVVARYQDQVIYLETDSGRGVALLGADVEAKPGTYPIVVAAVDRRGETSFHRTALKVRDADRPVERLTLPSRMVSPRKPEVIERILREKSRLEELFKGREGAPLWRAFRRPVGDPVSSPFGLRRILNGEPRSPHSGVDFRSPRGRSVKAAARGVVALADDLYFTGRTVILDHGEGLYTVYAHLEEITSSAGEVLDRGEVLGTVGSTGRSTGPHLHWGAKLRGDRIDPLQLVNLAAEEKP